LDYEIELTVAITYRLKRLTLGSLQILVGSARYGMTSIVLTNVGTLTRLPKLGLSLSWVKDIAYSARTFGADEALHVGFVSEVTDTKANGIQKALSKARTIAEKSPIAVQGTKNIIDYSRDHKIDEGLTYTAGKFLKCRRAKQFLIVSYSLECSHDTVGGLLKSNTVRPSKEEGNIREVVVEAGLEL